VLVAEKYWGPAEENITFLFSGELRASVEDASRNHDFERAFVADLMAACPRLRTLIVDAASGLVGSVTFHNRRHEARRSASDLGLLVTQPQVNKSPWPEALHIHTDVRRALLAQAKLGRVKPNGRERWGTLTPRQRELFPQRASYMALLLYRLHGTNANELDAFTWQQCAGVETIQVLRWLREGAFPSNSDSAKTVTALSEGEIGTTDSSVCDTVANPGSPSCRYIELRLSWPPGQKPPGGVVLQKTHQVASQLQIHVRR
jgi:hypothetical protein